MSVSARRWRGCAWGVEDAADVGNREDVVAEVGSASGGDAFEGQVAVEEAGEAVVDVEPRLTFHSGSGFTLSRR